MSLLCACERGPDFRCPVEMRDAGASAEMIAAVVGVVGPCPRKRGSLAAEIAEWRMHWRAWWRAGR